MLIWRWLMMRRPGSIREGLWPLLLRVVVVHVNRETRLCVSVCFAVWVHVKPNSWHPLSIESQEGLVRRQYCCKPVVAVTLVANSYGRESSKLLEGNLCLSLNLSQSESCHCSSTSHRSKYEMGPSGAVRDGECCTGLRPKGRSKVRNTVSVHSKAVRWKAEIYYYRWTSFCFISKVVFRWSPLSPLTFVYKKLAQSSLCLWFFPLNSVKALRILLGLKNSFLSSSVSPFLSFRMGKQSNIIQKRLIHWKAKSPNGKFGFNLRTQTHTEKIQ